MSTSPCMQASLLDYTQSEIQLRTARDSKRLNLASKYPAHLQSLLLLCVIAMLCLAHNAHVGTFLQVI